MMMRSPRPRRGREGRRRRRAQRGGRHERGDVARGGEPSGCRDVGVRHGVEDRRTEQVALSAEAARRERRRREARSVGAATIGVVTGSTGAGRRPDEVKRGVQRVLTEPTADMRSKLSEARAEALTLAEGEVRKPVTGEALTGAADVGGVADGERSDVAGGGEPKKKRHELTASHAGRKTPAKRRQGGRREPWRSCLTKFSVSSRE